MLWRTATDWALRVSLLHVLGRGERDADAREKAKMAIEGNLDLAGGAKARILLPEGDFMEEIAAESARGYQLLVMGTHGPHGLRQSLFGAHILKLVRRAVVPSFVVQAESPVDQELSRIVMPVAGHKDIGRLLSNGGAAGQGLGRRGACVPIGAPRRAAQRRTAGQQAAHARCAARERDRTVEANEPSTSFSVGFAKATVEYAQRVGAGAIAIMAHASEEYRYIADAEKERILANEARIPVICA
jgi:hypothetical protein